MPYTVTYRIMNYELPNPVRKIRVQASRAEIRHLVKKGYLVRPRLFTGAALRRVSAAFDAVVRAQKRRDQVVHVRGDYAGKFIGDFPARHAYFRDLVRFRPLLSIAQAVIGPQVEVCGIGGRITVPADPPEQTHWHFHHRVMLDKTPPFFCRPNILDVLIYLDGTEDGPLLVVPGSHERYRDGLKGSQYGDLPGQQSLRLPPGGAVIMHGNLWHRGLPPARHPRRILFISYGAMWLKTERYRPGHDWGLERSLLKSRDRELRELSGLDGFPI